MSPRTCSGVSLLPLCPAIRTPDAAVAGDAGSRGNARQNTSLTGPEAARAAVTDVPPGSALLGRLPPPQPLPLLGCSWRRSSLSPPSTSTHRAEYALLLLLLLLLLMLLPWTLGGTSVGQA